MDSRYEPTISWLRVQCLTTYEVSSQFAAHVYQVLSRLWRKMGSSLKCNSLSNKTVGCCAMRGGIPVGKYTYVNKNVGNLTTWSFAVADTGYWSSSRAFGHHWPSSGVGTSGLQDVRAPDALGVLLGCPIYKGRRYWLIFDVARVPWDEQKG